MKRPYPEIGDVKKVAYIGKLAFVRKFIRYWGTTTIDGVEVMNRQKYYYKSMDDSTTKLTKHLGIYKQLKSTKMKGVKKAWLYLNQNKMSGVDYDASILAANLSKALTEELKITIVLGPKVAPQDQRRFDLRNLEAVPVNTPLTDQLGVITEIKFEYQSYLDYGYHISSNKDFDIYQTLLAKYLLTSSDISYVVDKVSETYTEVNIPITYNGYNDATEEFETLTYYEVHKVRAYAVDVTIAPYVFSETTDMVVQLLAIANKSVADMVDNDVTTMQMIDNTSNFVFDDPEDDAPIPYFTFPFNDVDNLWYVPIGGTLALLRADALKGSVLSLDQKIELINTIIDSDFRRKSVNPWEKILAMVIIVIVIYFSAGYGAAAAASYLGTTAAMVAIAVTITTAALILSIVAAIAAGIGMTGTAMALGRFLKAMAPLITIASIITIYMAIQRLAQEGAKKIAEEGGKELAAGTIADITVENVMAGLKSQFSDILSMSSTDISMDQVMKATNMLFDAYQKQDMNDLQRQIADERSKLAEMEQAKEESKCRNLLMELAQVQYNPLQRDYSFYDSIYDRPYEKWATIYHTGNIQANMVNALWLTDTKNGIM